MLLSSQSGLRPLMVLRREASASRELFATAVSAMTLRERREAVLALRGARCSPVARGRAMWECASRELFTTAVSAMTLRGRREAVLALRGARCSPVAGGRAMWECRVTCEGVLLSSQSGLRSLMVLRREASASRELFATAVSAMMLRGRREAVLALRGACCSPVARDRAKWERRVTCEGRALSRCNNSREPAMTAVLSGNARMLGDGEAARG